MLYAVAKCHSQLLHSKMRRSLVKVVGISYVCDQNGDRLPKNDKRSHIPSMRLKRYFNAKCVFRSRSYIYHRANITNPLYSLSCAPS